MKYSDLASSLAVDRVEKQILEGLGAGRLEPHQRLLSERRMARRFKVSQHTVHRAVRRLIARGQLYSRGRSGVFVNGRRQEASFASPLGYPDPENLPLNGPFSFNAPVARTLVASIPVGAVPDQREMWRKITATFHEEYPFLRIEPRYNLDNARDSDNADIVFQGIGPLLSMRSKLRRLDSNGLLDRIGSGAELSPGILRLGQVGRTQYALPLMRTSAMIAVNRTILRRCGAAEDSIRTPVDILRVGRRVEETLQGQVIGTGYGVPYFAMLAGIHLERRGRRVHFDVPRFAAFLDQTRPYVRPHHDPQKYPSLRDFLDGRCAIYPTSLYHYPHLIGKPDELVLIRIPVEEGGCASEGAWLGGITQASAHPKDAALFLQFLASRQGQEAFAHHHPNWLSVRNDVLEWQKNHSPFPSGAVHYDFDLRGSLIQTDLVMDGDYREHYYVEVGRFYRGLQDAAETVANLQRIPVRPPPKPIHSEPP